MPDEINKGFDPTSPLEEGEAEPIPASGITSHPRYTHQKLDTNVTRLPVVLRPVSPEIVDRSSNVLPFVRRGPRGKTPGGTV